MLNNVATGAYHAVRTCPGVERVAVVDFDVHHGNGTQDILSGGGRSDHRFLFASVHAHNSEEGVYPGTGESDRVVLGQG